MRKVNKKSERILEVKTTSRSKQSLTNKNLVPNITLSIDWVGSIRKSLRWPKPLTGTNSGTTLSVSRKCVGLFFKATFLCQVITMSMTVSIDKMWVFLHFCIFPRFKFYVNNTSTKYHISISLKLVCLPNRDLGVIVSPLTLSLKFLSRLRVAKYKCYEFFGVKELFYCDLLYFDALNFFIEIHFILMP
jgi:hypothetical protein